MQPPSSRPAAAVGHVLLHVSSVPASARFYEQLGCRPVHASAELAILELRGGTHLMLFAGEPGERERPGFDLMVERVAAFRDALLAAGLACEPLERHERSGHEHFTCSDPDGYRVVVYSDHTDGRPV